MSGLYNILYVAASAFFMSYRRCRWQPLVLLTTFRSSGLVAAVHETVPLIARRGLAADRKHGKEETLEQKTKV
jgi:hypothetical protein